MKRQPSTPNSPDPWDAIDAALGPRIPLDSEAPTGAVSTVQVAERYGVSTQAAERKLKAKGLQSGLYMRRGRITRLYWPA